MTGIESSPVDPLAEACRCLMSCFPTGVAVVSSLDPQARPCGLTCSSLISVTLTPPTLLVSVHLRSSTLAAAQRLGGFAVNCCPPAPARSPSSSPPAGPTGSNWCGGDRGVVEVVIATVGLRLGVLSTATYTIILLVAVLTSVMAPPLLRWAMRHVAQNEREDQREVHLAAWTSRPADVPVSS